MSAKIVSLFAILFLLTVAGALFMISRQNTLLKTSVPQQATDEPVARPVYVVGENTPLPASDTCIVEHTACEEACAGDLAPGTEQEIGYEACLDECTSAFDVCMFDNAGPPSV